MTRTDLAYRKTAVEGASGFGLLIALYDTLASDLRRAAEAERANDIEKRSREVNHAFLVIGHLEDWLLRGTGGDLNSKLKAFYANLRKNLLQAQLNRSAAALEQEMASVLKIRTFWQQADMRSAPSEPSILRPVAMQNSYDYSGIQAEIRHCNWSA
ncbi:MAG: flagellar export chaperone FliS [Terracidiphilus sp.]